jgi:hypothetical protein
LFTPFLCHVTLLNPLRPLSVLACRDRRYVTAANTEAELEWHASITDASRESLRAHTSKMSEQLSSDFEMSVVGRSSGVSALVGGKSIEVFDELKSEVINDLRTLLAKPTSPLTARFELKSAHLEAEASAAVAQGASLLATASRTPGDSLLLEEELTPSAHLFILTKSFLRLVCLFLPSLSNTTTGHRVSRT